MNPVSNTTRSVSHAAQLRASARVSKHLSAPSFAFPFLLRLLLFPFAFFLALALHLCASAFALAARILACLPILPRVVVFLLHTYPCRLAGRLALSACHVLLPRVHRAIATATALYQTEMSSAPRANKAAQAAAGVATATAGVHSTAARTQGSSKGVKSTRPRLQPEDALLRPVSPNTRRRRQLPVSPSGSPRISPRASPVPRLPSSPQPVRAGSVETVEVELSNGRRVEVVQTRLVSPPQRVIVVVAGNPGLARFYSRFVKELHERTGAHCLALGHTGHGGGAARPVNPPLGLAAQIEDKRELLEKLAQRWPPGVEVMIAGHSIGAYMALHLLDTFPLLAKSRGFMLFPTVHHIGTYGDAQ